MASNSPAKEKVPAKKNEKLAVGPENQKYLDRLIHTLPAPSNVSNSNSPNAPSADVLMSVSGDPPVVTRYSPTWKQIILVILLIVSFVGGAICGYAANSQQVGYQIGFDLLFY